LAGRLRRLIGTSRQGSQKRGRRKVFQHDPHHSSALFVGFLVGGQYCRQAAIGGVSNF
jgi:hypothetical protein